jgi:hypothetical protein
MRYLYLTTVYPAYAAQFYAKRPDLVHASHATQRAALDGDAFAWNGAWGEPLATLGHELMEVTGNLRPLQRAWAAEHGVRWTPAWQKTVPLAQCAAFQPEVLLLDDLREYSAQWIDALRARVPCLRAVIGLMGSPSHDWGTIRACDAILAITQSYTEAVRREGGRALFFRHAFNSASAATLPSSATPRGISFCGNIQRGVDGHIRRAQFFHDVLSRVPLELYIPNGSISRARDLTATAARRVLYYATRGLDRIGVPRDAVRRLPVIGRATAWQSAPVTAVDPILRPYMRPPLFGRAMLQKLVDSFATVNIHGDAAGSEAVNMRLFEATGVGTCLLTDWMPSLAQVFDPEKEVVSFRSADEFVDRVRWLNENPDARDEIARAGQQRTLRDHTFFQRVHDLDALAQEVIRHRNGARHHVATG